ncbi:hypothetical protein B0G77_4859 [Paraburkholderia sp. BL10I2N1]|nr:hypothetical protein B0G77_4859 [Paraburkholderia sp. BL10I2N1]
MSVCISDHIGVIFKAELAHYPQLVRTDRLRTHFTSIGNLVYLLSFCQHLQHLTLPLRKDVMGRYITAKISKYHCIDKRRINDSSTVSELSDRRKQRFAIDSHRLGELTSPGVRTPAAKIQETRMSRPFKPYPFSPRLYEGAAPPLVYRAIAAQFTSRMTARACSLAA